MGVSDAALKFESLDELLGVPIADGDVDKILIRDIKSFKEHTFRVKDDIEMERLVESIRENGVITPVLVRPFESGYEMVSGHRRLFASKKIGLAYIPAIIKDMSDDEAIVAMIDSNLQREHVLPSERAWSFRKLMEVKRRQGFRSDVSREESTCGTEFHKSNDECKTRQLLGEKVGMTGRQVTKYIRLTMLVPKLLELVDKKKITITMGVDISYFDTKIQNWILEYFEVQGTISKKQIAALNVTQDLKAMEKGDFMKMMNETKQKENDGEIHLSRQKLSRFFPNEMSVTDQESVIYKLLEDWHKQLKG